MTIRWLHRGCLLAEVSNWELLSTYTGVMQVYFWEIGSILIRKWWEGERWKPILSSTKRYLHLIGY